MSNLDCLYLTYLYLFVGKQDQVLAVALTHKDCCEESSPEAIDKIVKTEWNHLITDFYHQTGLDRKESGQLMNFINRMQKDIDEIKTSRKELQNKESKF